MIDAEFVGVEGLPVVGAVTVLTAVLIRPEGYVGCVGNGSDTGLRDALTTWSVHHDEMQRSGVDPHGHVS